MERDPICGMEVDTSTDLKVDYKGESYYFCSSGCREKFMKDKGIGEQKDVAIDPICGMEVDKSIDLKVDYEGETYYFCAPGCREKFMKDKGIGEQKDVDIDPICGMEVDTSTDLKVDYKGESYYFCAPGCREKFMMDKGLLQPEEPSSVGLTLAIKKTGVKEVIKIGGMHCASCAATIEGALNKVEGVSAASVNFAAEKAYVDYDPKTIDSLELERVIEGVGYRVVKEDTTELNLKIIGMDEATSIHAVEAALNRVKGITQSRLLVNGKARISFDPSLVNKAEIKKAIRDSGFTPVDETTADREREERQREVSILRLKVIAAAIFALPLLYLSMGSHVGLPIPSMSHGTMALVQLILTTPIIAIGYQFYTVGIRSAIKNRSASMDTLVALGTGTAYVYSLVSSILIWMGTSGYGMEDIYFEVAGLLIVFIMLGRLLEGMAKRRTSDSIRALIALQPKTAFVVRNGSEVELSVEDVMVGDFIAVKPGASIPVDGVLVEGNSSIDESMLTGESIPADKGPGDEVIGGTINKSGWFRFRATRVGSDMALSRIVGMVEQAQGSKAPVQRLADRIAAYFVPVVLGIGLIAFVGWLASGSSFEFAMTAFIAVIIIACPCALGLATPTAIMVGMGLGAKNGILIRDAVTLEGAHRVDVVAFDKTGTLTKGKPEVVHIITQKNSSNEQEVLRIAAAAERYSEHPLSQAIVRRAEAKDIPLPEAKNFMAIHGKGVMASVEGMSVLVGNRKLMDERNVDVKDVDQSLIELEGEGNTVMLVAVDGRVLGVIATADTPKDSAVEAIAALKLQGKQVVMITGDNHRSAESIGRELGIDRVLAEVLPENKAAEVSRLQSEGHKVAMVGDGINDAPALAQADIGIAIGSGTDVAVEAGGIVLVKDDLSDIVRAMELGSYTMRKVKQNLFWALFYNSAGIPIAAGILYPFLGFALNPIIAGIAMAFSSISVVTNSLLMRRYHMG